MNRIQRRMLAPLASLDLLANPPKVLVPVHYIFGGRDALNPPAIVDRLPAVIAAPRRQSRSSLTPVTWCISITRTSYDRSW